jgi:heat shock protein HtpX
MPEFRPRPTTDSFKKKNVHKKVMKRIFLFLLTNIAVMIALSVTTTVIFSFIGVSMQEVFGQWSYLIVFAFVFGIGGSLISLLISKPMAKFSTGAKTIDGSEGEAERWLVATVEDLARRANIKTPEVAIYPGRANAFATGAFKNSALVAVSSDIMGQMTKEELRAVLGHEISHVANGDMVTLCLVQGVLNAFVILFSRIIASTVAAAGNENGRRRSNPFIYMTVVWVMEIVLGILAMLVVCAFSRRREYAADKGSANLLGTPFAMIAALRRLGNLQPGVLPDSLKAMGIAQGKRVSLWSTHPSIEDRIARLEQQY